MNVPIWKPGVCTDRLDSSFWSAPKGGPYNTAPVEDICPLCRAEIRKGDWPWGKGKPEDHANPHYGWSMR